MWNMDIKYGIILKAILSGKKSKLLALLFINL